MLGTNDTKPQNWKHEIVICTDYRDLVNPFIELESKSSVLFADPARSSGIRISVSWARTPKSKSRSSMPLRGIHAEYTFGTAEFAPQQRIASHPDEADKRDDEACGHAVFVGDVAH